MHDDTTIDDARSVCTRLPDAPLCAGPRLANPLTPRQIHERQLARYRLLRLSVERCDEDAKDQVGSRATSVHVGGADVSRRCYTHTEKRRSTDL
jgi:hypothetical protein